LAVSTSLDGSAKVLDVLVGGAVSPWEFAQESRDDVDRPGDVQSAEQYVRLVEQAQRCVQREEYADAVEPLRRAAELRRGYAEPYVLLGDCYLALQRAKEAVDAYRVAVQLQPDSGWNRYRLGESLRAIGENREALDTLIEACELLPDLAQVRLLLAGTYLNEKHYGDAVREYKEIISQLPQCHEAYHGLGLAHAHLGDLNLALEELGKAIEINRNHTPSYSAIVNLLLAAQPPRVSEATNWVSLARSQDLTLDDETQRRYDTATRLLTNTE
jgi:tetratricopeptide (TPR) repeat protein